jgi:DNA topoisomerase-3
MILAFGEDAQMITSTVSADFDGHQFSVEKSALKEKGWTAMVNRQFGNTDNPYVNYRWHEGEKEHFYGVSITKKSSKPVQLHTAETLLMEADLFDLGSTKEKADAVNMLFENGYIDAFDKEIVPTEKGLALYSVIRDMIIGSPFQMGHFNRRLSLGLYSKAQINNYTEAVVRELLSSETLFAKRAVPIDRATKKMIDNIKEEAS